MSNYIINEVEKNIRYFDHESDNFTKGRHRHTTDRFMTIADNSHNRPFRNIWKSISGHPFKYIYFPKSAKIFASLMKPLSSKMVECVGRIVENSILRSLVIEIFFPQFWESIHIPKTLIFRIVLYGFKSTVLYFISVGDDLTETFPYS